MYRFFKPVLIGTRGRALLRLIQVKGMYEQPSSQFLPLCISKAIFTITKFNLICPITNIILQQSKIIYMYLHYIGMLTMLPASTSFLYMSHVIDLQTLTFNPFIDNIALITQIQAIQTGMEITKMTIHLSRYVAI